MRRSALLATLLAASPAVFAQEPEITPEIQSMVRESARGWYEQGMLAERDGRTLEAEGQYRRALDTDPGLLGAQLGYARMLDARGRRADALRSLEAVPRRAWAGDREAMEYARALRAVGALDDALAALREHRDHADAMRLLAEMASQEGRFPEALAAARRLAELTVDAPEDGRAARVLVRALTRLVAEADAVRTPYATTAFRRALASE